MESSLRPAVFQLVAGLFDNYLSRFVTHLQAKVGLWSKLKQTIHKRKKFVGGPRTISAQTWLEARYCVKKAEEEEGPSRDLLRTLQRDLPKPRFSH